MTSADFFTLLSGASAIASLVTDHLTWPVVVLALAVVFRVHLSRLIARIVSLKYGETEVSFAEDSVLLMTGKLSQSEKKKLRDRQVVSAEGDFETGNGYRLYANGTISQRLKITARPGERAMLVFPIAFPNEVTSIQIVGEIDATIVEVTNGNCTVVYGANSAENVGKLHISGL
ncbi:hypothetical protein [Burkholderia cenocepacia]|uniref:hypothetical protein n=1 Tax=Burkholderia cenocepacia TaxID=95486 RepID=UPI002AB0AFAB|nr:hypothetical protein [Burkholderia cenocepacia]